MPASLPWTLQVNLGTKPIAPVRKLWVSEVLMSSAKAGLQFTLMFWYFGHPRHCDLSYNCTTYQKVNPGKSLVWLQQKKRSGTVSFPVVFVLFIVFKFKTFRKYQFFSEACYILYPSCYILFSNQKIVTYFWIVDWFHYIMKESLDNYNCK